MIKSKGWGARLTQFGPSWVFLYQFWFKVDHWFSALPILQLPGGASGKEPACPCLNVLTFLI